jgi:hypothetical protein
MWPITGMPASVTLRIWSATRTPPSNFTAWQPPSFMKRMAVSRACEGPSS